MGVYLKTHAHNQAHNEARLLGDALIRYVASHIETRNIWSIKKRLRRDAPEQIRRLSEDESLVVDVRSKREKVRVAAACLVREGVTDSVSS